MKMSKLIVLTMISTIALSVSIGHQAEAGTTKLHSWDQKIDDASKRFEVLSVFNNEAVLDKETGLVWEQSPDANTFFWTLAMSHCYTLELGGRKGWRLPTVEELSSLVDTTQSDPALPSGHPFSNVILTPFTPYWSASTVADNTVFAWTVGFHNGYVFIDENKGLYQGPAWCVRAGQGVYTQ